jgi:hypothetical protein
VITMRYHAVSQREQWLASLRHFPADEHLEGPSGSASGPSPKPISRVWPSVHRDRRRSRFDSESGKVH